MNIRTQVTQIIHANSSCKFQDNYFSVTKHIAHARKTTRNTGRLCIPSAMQQKPQPEFVTWSCTIHVQSPKQHTHHNQIQVIVKVTNTPSIQQWFYQTKCSATMSCLCIYDNMHVSNHNTHQVKLQGEKFDGSTINFFFLVGWGMVGWSWEERASSWKIFQNENLNKKFRCPSTQIINKSKCLQVP